MWRLADTDEPVFRAVLDGQEHGLSPALHLEGHTLRYLEGGTVHTLDLGAAVTTAWRPTAEADVVLSPDGRTFATGRSPRRCGEHSFEHLLGHRLIAERPYGPATVHGLMHVHVLASSHPTSPSTAVSDRGRCTRPERLGRRHDGRRGPSAQGDDR